jgi:hypothetical protein
MKTWMRSLGSEGTNFQGEQWRLYPPHMEVLPRKMKVLASSTQKTGDRMMMNDAYASHTF